MAQTHFDDWVWTEEWLQKQADEHGLFVNRSSFQPDVYLLWGKDSQEEVPFSQYEFYPIKHINDPPYYIPEDKMPTEQECIDLVRQRIQEYSKEKA